MLGLLLTIAGFMGLIYWSLDSLLTEQNVDPMKSARGISSIVFVLAGLITYYIGKPISKIIGKDLSD